MSIDREKTLLLVEDEPVIAMVTAKMLKRSGYEVIIAYNGSMAADMALSDLSIDLILMDIDLGGGINGPEAARRILGKRNIPIVFLTSHSEQEIVEMVREITRYGYVIKNSGDFVLLSSIEMAFELFDSHERLKASADTLRISEEKVRSKLDSILSPEGDIGDLDLADIVDIKMLQSIIDDFHSLFEIGVAIADLKGNIVASSGWQDICRKFHRTNPETLRNCIESDNAAAVKTEAGKYYLYKCKNNIWDMTTPIEVGGKHIGNLFLGQFLFMNEEIDFNLYRSQAKRYGFNESEYIKALERVPRFNEEVIHIAMTFYIKFAGIISRLSYSNIKLAKTLAERDHFSSLHKEVETQLSNVTEHMVDLVARLDSEGFFKYASPSFKKVLGFRPEELAGTWAPEIFHPSSREKNIKEITAICKAGKGFAEFRQRCRDGTYRWFEATGVYIYNEKGQITGSVLGARDITEKKIAERRLRKKDKQYGELFERMIDGFALHEIVVDDWGNPVDYIFLEVNPAFEKYTGLNAAEITGKRVREVIPGIEFYWIETYGRVALKGEQITFENYTSPLNRWYKVTAYSPERGIFATIFEDITDRKRGEELLRERDERYKRIFESVVGYVYTVYIENKIPVRTVHGPGCEVITGYAPDDFIRDPELWYKVIYPDDRGRVILFASDIIHKGIFSPIEHRIICRDGTVQWVRNTPVPHYNENNELIEYDSVIAEITDYRNVVESLKKSEEMLWNIINSSPDFVYVKDTDLKLVMCNEAYASSLNKKAHELAGKTDAECGWSEDYVKGNIQKGIRGFEPDDLRVLNGEKITAQIGPVLIKGRTRYFETIKVPVYTEGKVAHLLGISRDITDHMAASHEKHAVIDLFRIINSSGDTHSLMKSVLYFLKKWSGCEAVGIRLREGDDYPYFETEGFPGEFIRLENNLCARDSSGSLMHDDKGDPFLECMCGNIICGRFDPSKSFFTEHGSFWSNCTTDLLSSTTDADRQTRTRNRCNSMGYESVALIPLRAGSETFGLIQLNDKRKGMFTGGIMELFERLGDNIAIALSEKMIRRKLSERVEQYRTVADFTYDWEFWIAPDGRMLYCSPSCERITGYRDDEFLDNPKLLRSIVIDEDLKSPCISDAVVFEFPETNEMEFRIIHKDGRIIWIGHTCRSVYDSKGNFTGRRGSNRDITESKESFKRINSLLKEKEILLSEVHHRIKNNMNTISGLLMLQAASMDNTAAVTALDDARSRVQSMMIMYDKLYRSEDYRKMPVREYFEKFIDEILIIFENRGLVSIEKDIDNFVLDTKILFPLSIIINELVTNVFKYAFPDGRTGFISLSVKKCGNVIKVLIRDDGVGVPDKVTESQSGGFGLSLISALAGQIGGEFRIKNDNGTVAEVLFKNED